MNMQEALKQLTQGVAGVESIFTEHVVALACAKNVRKAYDMEVGALAVRGQVYALRALKENVGDAMFLSARGHYGAASQVLLEGAHHVAQEVVEDELAGVVFTTPGDEIDNRIDNQLERIEALLTRLQSRVEPIG